MRERYNLIAMQAWLDIMEAIGLTYPQNVWISLCMKD